MAGAEESRGAGGRQTRPMIRRSDRWCLGKRREPNFTTRWVCVGGRKRKEIIDGERIRD